MNRIIKFRAWDNIRQRMYLPRELTAGNDCEYSYPIIEQYFITQDYGYRQCKENFLGIYPTSLFIQQFTNLKDTVGKEIYDGDILNSKPSRYKVFFDEGCWKVESIMGLNVGKIQFLNNVIEYSFIIGNIYENPDLLK